MESVIRDRTRVASAPPYDPDGDSSNHPRGVWEPQKVHDSIVDPALGEKRRGLPTVMSLVIEKMRDQKPEGEFEIAAVT
jgi:hypothetical protein